MNLHHSHAASVTRYTEANGRDMEKRVWSTLVLSLDHDVATYDQFDYARSMLLHRKRRCTERAGYEF